MKRKDLNGRGYEGLRIWLRRVGGTSLAALALAGVRAEGQAVETATRKAGLSAFGEYVRVSPDYGPKNNVGGSAGIDFEILRHGFTPALEIRATYATGNTVVEKTFGGGLRLEKQFRRIHPFGELLVGAGYITFVHPGMSVRGLYKSDDSIVFTYGGGADFDVSRRFAIRGEYDMQHWTLGRNQTLTPSVIGVGVVYRIAR